MPGYQVKHETHLLGTSNFEIRSLLDRQQYADPDGAALAAGISCASWPLFGMVWPSARMLAGAMQTYHINGKRILEVGCGLALASLVIHRRLGDITASDCHPLTEGFLRENLRLNHLPRLKYQTGHWNRENPALGRFDLIIASDVLYERNQPEVLANFIDIHANERAQIIVLDPDRGNRNAFCRSMVARGYESDVQRAGVTQCTGEAYKGHFLNFSR
jgi:2-polyprenyl-3-methyl-5-hydroxy-6-metoxy-1,4-benzoquinol methylase